MSSLQILEGLIGTACALACLYYARQGSLATVPQSSPRIAVPWHSAVGEYARRNPFAAAFGALALGFLISSWSMYISPRAVVLAPQRTVEKWHTITRTVATADPAQTAKITELQNTIATDQTTIAQLKSDVDRLNRLLTRHTAARRSYGETANTTLPGGYLDAHPAAADVGAANPGPVATPPAQSNQVIASPAPGNSAPASPSNAAPPPTTTVPHQ